MNAGTLDTQPQLRDTYEHDPKSFCQGILIHNGYFYESRGLYGESQIRKVEIATGKVVQSADLDKKLFAEGIVIFDGQLIQMTWREGVVLFWDIETLTVTKTMKPPPTTRNEGWGFTTDGTHLIMSDGSSFMHFWDPVTLKEVRRQEVTLNGEPLQKLNELEYVNGVIVANVWYSDSLFVIDPQSGKVIQTWDYTHLHKAVHTGKEDCFNGIAYDNSTASLYVTGKLWSKLFRLDQHGTPLGAAGAQARARP